LQPNPGFARVTSRRIFSSTSVKANQQKEIKS
jgi:hypothetical protein